MTFSTGLRTINMTDTKAMAELRMTGLILGQEKLAGIHERSRGKYLAAVRQNASQTSEQDRFCLRADCFAVSLGDERPWEPPGPQEGVSMRICRRGGASRGP